MSTATELTIEEMVESLTGYEEIAIAKHFGDEVTDLLQKKPTMGLRSLVFVHRLRGEGVKAEAAKTFAMEATVKTVTTAYFRDDEGDEIDPETLESESGKEPEHSE